MYRLFLSEIKKIYGRKLFWGILVGLLIFNIFFLWYVNRPNDERPPLNSYRMLRKELSDLSNHEWPNFIEKYYNDVVGAKQIERIKNYESWQNEQGDFMAENIKKQFENEYNHFLSIWKSGKHLRYTQNIQQEFVFAEQIYTEFIQLAGYPVYLQGIGERAETLSGISIFSKNTGDGFSNSNIKKTAEDYKAMTNTDITFDISYGVTSATSSLATDCIVFIFLFILAFLMIYDEKDNGLFALVKATPKGRLQTICAKMTVLAFSSTGIVLLMYGSNILFFHFTTGLGDLSRSIQSIGLFMGSTMHLSVGGFLICFLAMKFLACFLIGLMVMLFSVCMRKIIPAFLLCGTILIISFLLYSFIPDNNQLTILKHINMFGLFRVQNMLGLYLNLNIFGKAVSLFAAGIITTLSLVALFMALIGGVFTRSHEMNTSQFNLHLPLKWQRKIKNSAKSVWRHELYKVLWINKAAILLIGFIIISIYEISTSTIYLSPDEFLYRAYMEKLEGPVTKEKVNFLNTEQERFELIQIELDTINEQMVEGKITETQAEQKRQTLEREQYKQQVFDRVWNQYESLDSTGWFVYETGYINLFDLEQKNNSSEMLIICLMLIACGYSIFPIEYKNDTDKLIKTTVRGRDYTFRVKTVIALVIMLLIAVIGMLPTIISVTDTYGLPALSAPASSLSCYMNLPSFISIGGLLATIYILKLLACTAVLLLVIGLSRIIRHSIYTLLICSLIVGIPVILTVMGINWCGYMGFMPLFDAGALIVKQKTLIVIIYSVVAVIITAGYIGTRKKIN